MPSRRQVLSYALWPAAAAAFSSLPTQAHAQAKRLVVGTWGGDYGELLRQYVDAPLQRSDGITVVQQIGAGDRMTRLLAERTARRGSFDIVAQSDGEAFRLHSAGVLRDIDEDKVSRLSAVLPALRESYLVPHMYSALVLLYNPDRIKTAPESFADLWNPAYRGRVGLSDILFRLYPLMASLVATGRQDDLDAARKQLLELRALDTRVYPSNEAVAAALKSEEIWITPMWLARGVQWLNAGIPVKRALPREGAFSVSFNLCVPRNSRNHELAWSYMNAALQPESQLEFAKKMGYMPSVTDAKLPAELARMIDPTPGERTSLITPDSAFSEKYSSEILDFWNKEFKG